MNNTRDLSKEATYLEDYCTCRVLSVTNRIVESSISKTIDRLSLEDNRYSRAKSGALLIDELLNCSIVPTPLVVNELLKMKEVLDELN